MYRNASHVTDDWIKLTRVRHDSGQLTLHRGPRFHILVLAIPEPVVLSYVIHLIRILDGSVYAMLAATSI